MKIDRLLAIIMVLLERDQACAGELAEMFEVSERTIYRDVDAINQAGIPVVAQRGPGGGIGILKSYKIEKRLFSGDEITTLLRSLDSIQRIVPGHDARSTMAKVRGLVPAERRAELSHRADEIRVDLSPWLHAGVAAERIASLHKAVQRRQLVRFVYRDGRGRRTERRIEPYRLLLKEHDWYVQGFCLTRMGPRTFKVLRIEQLFVLDETFEPRAVVAGEPSGPTRIGEEELVEVTLLVREDAVDQIISRFGDECLADEPCPPGRSAKTEKPGVWYRAKVRMPVSDLAARYLLSFGTSCICLEPARLRRRLRDLVDDVGAIYQDDAPTVPSYDGRGGSFRLFRDRC